MRLRGSIGLPHTAGSAAAAVAALAVCFGLPTASSGWQITASSSANARWTDQVVAKPAGYRDNRYDVLQGLSCASATACVAVGYYNAESDGGGSVSLVERWDGTRWHVGGGAVHGGQLTSVSCASQPRCIAVGTTAIAGRPGQTWPLVERADGGHWTSGVLQRPKGTNAVGLNSVSCTSATACVAIGNASSSKTGSEAPLAAVWDGTKWTEHSVPAPQGAVNAALFSVSCASAHACTAVGGYQRSSAASFRPLAERWNGTSWSIQAALVPPGRDDAAFAAVACPSAATCIAVGSNESGPDAELAEIWDGTRWKLQQTGRASSDASAISCLSGTYCTAVGGLFMPSRAEVWNGSKWNVQLPNGIDLLPNRLYALACSAPNSCIAVGEVLNTDGLDQSRLLAEHETR